MKWVINAKQIGRKQRKIARKICEKNGNRKSLEYLVEFRGITSSVCQPPLPPFSLEMTYFGARAVNAMYGCALAF